MKVSTELHQAAPPLLELSGVMKRFGTTIAVNGVDLEVERGQVLCIIGPSGCGKSTLLRCVNWLETPDQGTVRLNGAPIGNTGPRNGRYAPSPTVELNRMRARIGMIYQQFNVWPHLSVLDNVMRAQIVVLRRDRITARARSMALLDRVGLADRAHAHPQQLSGGQCQRVAIARALAMDPELLLLDEPTSALDPELVGEVLQVLRDLAASGMTMLLVTHELGFARHAADTLVFMDRGEIVEQGTPVNLLDSPRTARLQAFLSRISQSRTVRGHTPGTVIPSGTGQTRAPVATAFDAASRPGQLGALVNARHGTA